MTGAAASPGSLRLSRTGAVGTLLIDRPQKRNSLDGLTLRQLPEFLSEAAADPALRVLIVTGGARSDFSAGADIDEFDAICTSKYAVIAFERDFAAAQSAVEDFPKPIVAMISGACIGGGCGLVLGCDVRLADTGARFGITPAKLGLAYGLADTRRLVEAVGPSHAADLLLSARLIDAAHALRIGLATAVVDPDQLLAHTLTWAEAVAANAPSSLHVLKQTLRRVRGGAWADDPASRAAFVAAFDHDDFREGRRAFAERRVARFTLSSLAEGSPS